MDEELKYWIWLSKLNLNFESIIKCLKFYQPSQIFKLSKEILRRFFLEEEIEKILDNYYKKDLSFHTNFLKKYGIKVIPIINYPQKLKLIENPPLILYALGNIKLIQKRNIAIVGSRKCSKSGMTIAKAFSYLLAKNDFVITSGLAEGIDASAHIGCMMANGNTIAVVGTGLDIIYPKENKELFNSILQNKGLIISEFPIGTKPEKFNFPKRNRIISALSDGILVVEAAKRSGALITVDFGLEQGKNIYAIPGNILNSASQGTNELIKDGAKMVTDIWDILEDFTED